MFILEEDLCTEKPEACSKAERTTHPQACQNLEIDGLPTFKTEFNNNYIHEVEINKGNSTRILRIGIGLNMALAFIEVVVDPNHHSAALLSDAVHNLVDAAKLGIILISSLTAKKRPVLSACINVVVLLTSIGIPVYAAFMQLLRPEAVSLLSFCA